MQKPSLINLNQKTMSRGDSEAIIDRYLGYHDEASGGDVAARKTHYRSMVSSFYDLVTDFYEFGWGRSFHFAPRYVGEGFEASLARHQFYLAHRLGLGAGDHALDLGCGVGGPMRAIARFTGARITGVNVNRYQIQRGEAHNRAAGLAEQCRFLEADFLRVPAADASFDAAFTIEAACHAPRRRDVFAEAFRLLKPGAGFVGYEWCLTSRYDAANATHRQIKKGIEEGNGLPDLIPTRAVDDALRAAGFEVVDTFDKAPEADPQTPWYGPLAGDGELSLRSLGRSRVGGRLTKQALRLLETVRLAPAGTVKVSEMLNDTADALIAGGKSGIFTPMYFFYARKPA